MAGRSYRHTDGFRAPSVWLGKCQTLVLYGLLQQPMRRQGSAKNYRKWEFKGIILKSLEIFFSESCDSPEKSSIVENFLRFFSKILPEGISTLKFI